MGITVRELVTKLSVDGNNATSKLAKFGLAVNGAKAALGLLTGAFGLVKKVAFGFVNEQTAAADVIAKTARALGIESKELQRLAFIADRSGVSTKTLAKATNTLAQNMRDASTSAGKEFVLALKQVGLETKDLFGLNLEQRFAKIGEALQTLPDKTNRLAVAQRLLGTKSGGQLASMLELNTEQMKAMGDEAERLGFVLSDEALAGAEAFQDAVTDLNTIITGLKRSIGVELAPTMTKLLLKFKEWLVLNRKVIRQGFQKFIDGVSVAVQHVMENFDDWMATLEEFIGLVTRTFSLLGDLVKAVGGIENAIKLAAVAWGVYALAQAAAFGPIGIVVAGLLALAAAFIDVETGAERAARAQERFGKETGSEKALSKMAKARLIDLTSAGFKSGKFSKDLVNLLAGVGGKDLLDIQREAKRSVVGGGGAGAGGGGLGVSGIGRGIGVDAGARAKQLAGLIRLRKIEVTKEIESRKAAILRTDAAKAESASDAAAAKRAAAEAAAAKRLRGLSGAGKSKAGDKPLTDDELFKLIQTASETGQSLTGLIGTRKIEGGTPPVVAVKITKITVTQNIDAPVTVNGVEGEDAEGLSERVLEGVREIWREEVEEALQELTPAMAR